MKARILDTDYVVNDEEVTLRLFCKNEDDESVLGVDKDFLPYFYVLPEDDVGALKEKIEKTTFSKDDKDLEISKMEIDRLSDGKSQIEVLKIFTNIPANVTKLKNQIWDLPETRECREFDIPFYRRYMMDKNLRVGETYEIKGGSKETSKFDHKIKLEDIKRVSSQKKSFEWDVLAFDIEVYRDKVIMISLISENYEKLLTIEEVDREYAEVFGSEKELLEGFREIINIQDPDVVTGYNTDEFDFKVLRERFEKYDLSMDIGRNGERMKFNRRGRFAGARIKGRMHLDIYPFVTHVLAPGLESERLDLDSVSEEVIGKRKDQITWEEMKKSWKNKENLEKLADYALKDSQLAYELGEEIIPQIIELSRVTGLIPFDACRLTYGQLTENFLLREAHNRDMLAENRPGRDERRKRQRQTAYEGGFVYAPEPGLYENIATLDFRSLYPTVMVSHNISPETLNLEDCEEEYEVEELEHTFCQDERGFFPDLIRELVEDRYKLKEKMENLSEQNSKYKALDSEQKAKKILANSFYGYLGYEGARWYSRECAETTTYLGRKYIEETIEKAEQDNFEVTYGDTDSVFLRKQNMSKKDIESFLNRINTELPDFMELEFEGMFERGFFTSTSSGEGAKKKYALIDQEGNMKITGFEQVRRDWSPIAKETQKKVLRKVLEDNIDEAVNITKETIDKLKQGDVPVEKLKIYTTLTKDPEEYDSTAPHVEAAKKAMRKGDKIEPETTIEYVITRKGRSISDQAKLVKYAEDYDSDYYIEKQIIPVTLRVLKVFGYTEGQLKGKGRQSGLSRFS